LRHVISRVAAGLALTAFGLLTAGAASAAVPTGAAVDGIRCDPAEGVALHIHAHLTIVDHGKPVGIPEDIGRPLAGQCFYWLHTHTPDGIIHIESPSMREFTLGQVFDIWGQPLSAHEVAGAKTAPGQTVKVYVDGEPYTGNPRAIELAQHLDVAILVGPPYAKPPPFTDWKNL
jgi:hypothetical protein